MQLPPPRNPAGLPFGTVRGVFVPCRVKMSDGRIEKIVLALRNDNPTGSWVADGGL